MNEFELYVMSLDRFKNRKPVFVFQLNENGDYDNQDVYVLHHAWQASASREGYKLVPKSFIADIHDMALDGKYLRETDQSQEKFTEIHELCKEIMIGVIE